jgi:hypothetical protein
MDTDTIVTHDLGEIFDKMGDRTLAMSSGIELRSAMQKQRQKIARLGKLVTYHWPPVHFSSGLMALKGYPPEELAEGWRLVMEWGPFVDEFRRYSLAEEMALGVYLSCVVEDPETIYHIPYEIHGNLLGGKKIFGSADIPWVIHYHKPERLKRAKLERYLEV